jgi:hypothetical protein
MSDYDRHDSDDEYYERIRALLEDAYVSADERGDVFGGSGSSGDMTSWEAKRRVIARAFYRAGSWLDVGCANGLLMETLTAWVAERPLYRTLWPRSLGADCGAGAQAPSALGDADLERECDEV